MLGLWILSTTALFRGRFEQGLSQAKSAALLYDPDKHRDLARDYGVHPAPSAMDWEAWGHWLTGYPEAYRRKDQDALALTREINHPLTSAMVIVHSALWHSMRDDAAHALTHAQETIALCQEAGIPLRRIEGEIIEGWALAEQGEIERGIAEIEQGMADWRAIDAEIARPWWLALLAKARLKSGEPEKAILALREGLEIIEVSEERAWEAELNRLTGVALLAKDASDNVAADACFAKAIAVAQSQKAKSLELRAATALARLWQSQNKSREAHDLLAPVYGWFTEGFDTADLKDAKALLDELA
jgi:predicted ATPase